MSCAIAGCAATTRLKRGLCAKHYQRLRQHGDPTADHRRRAAPLADRIAAGSLVVESGCWEWQKFLDGKGYGRVQVEKRARRAHAVSWEVANGRPVPLGMVVCHRCDNPRCVNPDHLFIGTPAENVADMDAKGRRGAKHGSDHGSSKLSDADVLTIRTLRDRRVPASQIAPRFGVSESLIYQIGSRHIWKHLPESESA